MAARPNEAMVSTKLRTGDRIPSFDLESAGGEEVRSGRFRGRSQLLLVFLPDRPRPRDEAYLRDLVAQLPEIAEADSQLLVVAPRGRDEASALVRRIGLAAPVLLDPSRETYRAYGLDGPAGVAAGVFVADRYLRLAAQAVGPTLDQTMSVPEAIEWLRYLAFQCSECADVTSWAGVMKE